MSELPLRGFGLFLKCLPVFAFGDQVRGIAIGIGLQMGMRCR